MSDDLPESTAVLVRKAAIQMLLDGKTPNGDAIRKLTQQGSMTTIYKHLQDWCIETGQYLAMPRLDPKLAAAMQEIWTGAVTTAQQLNRAELDRTVAELEATKQANARLNGQVQELNDLMKKFEIQRDSLELSLNRQLDELNAKLQVKSHTITQMGARNGTLEQALGHAQQEVSRLSDRFAEQMEKSEQRYKDLENKLLLDADRERQQLKERLLEMQAQYEGRPGFVKLSQKLT